MFKVIILCGKIASGKTYYAQKIKEKDKAIVLSVDDLMLNLSDSCLGPKHDDIARRCEKYFYRLAEDLLLLNLEVVIDFGYWTKREREDAKSYFSVRNIPVEIHYIKVNDKKRIEQLAKRNLNLHDSKGESTSRQYIITDELRKRLDNKFEEPSHDEIDYIWDGDALFQ